MTYHIAYKDKFHHLFLNKNVTKMNHKLLAGFRIVQYFYSLKKEKMNNNKTRVKSRKTSAKNGNLNCKDKDNDSEKSELNESDLCFRVDLFAYGEYGKALEDWPESEADLIELND